MIIIITIKFEIFNRGKKYYHLGFSAGSLIEATLHINPDILPKALISAGLIFICFSLSSIYGNTLQTLYYGGLLFSGLSFLSFMAILNIFFNSQWLYQVNNILVNKFFFLTKNSITLGILLFGIFHYVRICNV